MTILAKPLFRGHLHQAAFFVSLGACMMLVGKGTTSLCVFSATIFSFGLLTLFGISALYHRKHWEPKARTILKRLDHAAIFILIASTGTPIALLAMPMEEGKTFLSVIWFAAVLGILQSVFWVQAPKFLKAIFYVAMGWAAAPFMDEMSHAMGFAMTSILVLGGVVYTLGAVAYSLKWPRLNPKVFGYHELFHLFTLVGAGLHFFVIYQLIK